jgi:2,3-dihydroxyphenylpropionate 1,2-dioxygenase
MAKGEIDSRLRETVNAQFGGLAAEIRAFAPDQIIEFAPDHFNGFFYDLMPSFCVGVHAASLGDWGGQTGKLPVDERFASELAAAVLGDEVDVAVSYRMHVDHGFVQIWEKMFGRFDAYPIVPIFINCAAPPLPRFRRARLLGEAVGRYALASGKRVLFAASGGLSHDPPAPDLTTATPEIRERLIDGRHPTMGMRDAREARVLEAGRLAARGEGPCLPLNATWDSEVLALLRAGELARFDALNMTDVRRTAGRGAAEVLCWVAAFAALSVAGPYAVGTSFYTPIPGWIAGMAMLSAHSSARDVRAGAPALCDSRGNRPA